MKIWFGSEPSFEDTVRTEVLDILNRDLTEKVFSTPWALGVTFPLVLAFMDLSASFAHASSAHVGEELWHHPATCYCPSARRFGDLVVVHPTYHGSLDAFAQACSAEAEECMS